MPVYEVDGKKPVIGEGTFVAPSADIIGEVTIGKNCYIGFGAVIRADFGPITIGDETLVEENVVIHTGTKAVIGNRVIIGHMAMIHDVVIHDNCLIGMQSMICNNAVIHENAFIAEQSLVRKNQVIPAGKVCAGSPAVPLKDIEDYHREGLDKGIKVYTDLIQKYHDTMKRIK